MIYRIPKIENLEQCVNLTVSPMDSNYIIETWIKKELDKKVRRLRK